MDRFIQSVLGMIICVSLLVLIGSCNTKQNENTVNQFSNPEPIPEGPFVIVLGTVQDGGSPHIGCVKECCIDLWDNPSPKKKVVSLGIIDPKTQKSWIIEATPDLPSQIRILNSYIPENRNKTPDGILLTHAHIGHYTGLMFLGREALGSKGVPVYCMPKMADFLSNNGPWDQLVKLDNIKIMELNISKSVALTHEISISPIQVPHRDEYSETVGYKINGPEKSVLFIPDIDKWEKWDRDILEEIRNVDIAFLDGSFYDGNELPGRDMKEIPHPFVVESMELFNGLTDEQKKKIFFIHFNHTNPLLNEQSLEYNSVISEGYNVASFLQIFPL